MLRSRVNFLGDQKRVAKGDAARQKRTLEAVLKRLRAQPGVVLADEVGMGKTYVALGVIAEYLCRYPKSRVLVLTPSTDLAEKWTGDLRRFSRENVPKRVGRPMAPKEGMYDWSLEEILETRVKSRVWILPLSVFMYAKTRAGKKEANVIAYQLLSKSTGIDRESRRELWKRLGGRGRRLPRLRKNVAWFEDTLPSLKKTVRKLLRRENVELQAVHEVPDYKLRELRDKIRWSLIRRQLREFSLIVVDEAHHLRNPDSKKYAAIENVFEKSFRDMLFLTATPFQLGPDELRHILELFRHSHERSDEYMRAEAKRVTDCAREYQDLVRAFEQTWRTLSACDQASVCAGNLRSTSGLNDFRSAYGQLELGHERLQQTLSQWVIRNVKEREYRRPVDDPITISGAERLPFAILHRLLYEYQRKQPTFAVVQNLSLTSSWEAFDHSVVMNRPLKNAPAVGFYRRLLKQLRDSQANGEHPKVRALVETVRDAFRDDEKVLIFTSRLDTVKVLQDRLNRELEEAIYGRLGLARKEVDRRIAQLRKRSIDPRDPLWLRFHENYFRTHLTRLPHVDDIYPVAVKQLDRFGPQYRVGKMGKAKGPRWDYLHWLCEWLIFGQKAVPGIGIRDCAPAQYWRRNIPFTIWQQSKPPKRLSPDEEYRILKSHYTTRDELIEWLHAILNHSSVWDEHFKLLKRYADLDLREELLDGVARVVFQPEYMGLAATQVGRRKRGLAEQAIVRAFCAPRVASRIRRFLDEMNTLPDEEVREYASGLRTENLVARASGDESAADRRRYRYGFNTPFRPFVLVASDVMQEGIDLHRECRSVIHYDLAWNPARLEQRVGRVDRLGSRIERMLQAARDARLDIFRRYLPGTIDERMYLRVRDRERWFKFILGHRPEWDEDSQDGTGGPPLPERFGKKLRIQLSD